MRLGLGTTGSNGQVYEYGGMVATNFIRETRSAILILILKSSVKSILDSIVP
jgi:hypothetical protein